MTKLKIPRKAPARPKSKGLVLGLDRFAKISAVEGIKLSGEMQRDFRSFDQEGLSAAERRRRLISKYGKAAS